MPFAGYANFDECVADNQDKASPEGFCAHLHYQVTGMWPSEKDTGGIVENIAYVEKSLVPGSLDWVRYQVEEALYQMQPAMSDYFAYVSEVFPDHVIVNVGNNEYLEIPYTVDNETISLGEPKEVKLAYVEKDKAEIGGPIVGKNASKQISYAAVLIPGEPDTDGDVVSKDKIEEVAHLWMEKYQNLDKVHNLNNVDAVTVESYITPIEMTVKSQGEEIELPIGTWILATKVRDSELWKQIEDGEITGYSIMAIRKSALKDTVSKDANIGQVDASYKKRTTLRDLDNDWIVPYVSFAIDPAVQKAKFFALKDKERKGSDSFYEKLTNLISGPTDNVDRNTEAIYDQAVKEGRKISEANLKKLRNAFTEIQAVLEAAETEAAKKDSSEGEIDVNKEEMEQMLKPFGDALEEIKTRLDSVETKQESPAAESSEEEETESSEEGTSEIEEKFDHMEQELASVKEKLDEVAGFLQPIAQRVGKSAPKSLRGQDDKSSMDDDPAYKEEDPKYYRDAFGRARPKTKV